jgi:hypothetical protein
MSEQKQEQQQLSIGSSVDGDHAEVSWDGDNDPEHPYNAPRWRINLNAVLLSVLGFLVPLSSGAFVVS